MELTTGAYYVDGKTTREIKAFPEFPQNSKLYYEVLRVIDGIPLFAKEHFERFRQSVKKEMIVDFDDFRKALLNLIQANRLAVGNIKLLAWKQEDAQHLFYYFIPHIYPEPKDYETGVCVGLLEAERKNPQVKVVQPNVRERANQLLKINDWYEVLLVNHSGCITEGSRSNVFFFVKGNQLFTPDSKDVLPGITRQKVLKCILDLGYQCTEKKIKLHELADFDAAFLTGTSPKVLPVLQIDKINYHADLKLLKLIIQAYELIIQQDILNFSISDL